MNRESDSQKDKANIPNLLPTCALNDSTDLLGKIFASIDEAVFLVDSNTRTIKVCNDAVKKIFGYEKEELIGNNTEFLHVDREAYETFGEKLFPELDKKGIFKSEYRAKKKSGEIFYSDHTVSEIKDATGNRIGLVSVVRDITERKRAEEGLNRYEHIVCSSTDMIALLNNEFRYLAVNTTYIKVFGKSKDEVIGHTVSEVFDNKFFNEVIKPNALICLAGKEINYQEWFEFPITGRKYMDIHYYPYIGVDNEIEGFFVNARDITEQKQAQDKLQKYHELLEARVQERTKELELEIAEHKKSVEALKENKAMLNQAQAIVHLGSWTWNLETGKINWSDEMYRIFGYEQGSFIPTVKNYMERIHPDDRKRVQEEAKVALQSGTELEGEHRVVRINGEIRWIFEKGNIIRNNERMPVFMVGTSLDITERKKAEEELKQSEARMRHLFEHANDAIFIVDPETRRFLNANENAARQLGYTREELLQLTIDDIASPNSTLDLKASSKELKDKGSFIGEHLHLRKDGTDLPVEISSRIIDLDNKKVTFAFVRNITERKVMEEELLKSQKLESLSVLAGGIAHDFNNFLQGILGNISLAKMKKTSGDETDKLLSNAEKAATMASSLTQQLLTFSKGGAPIKRTADILDLVKDTASFALKGSSSKCEFEVADDLHTLEVDKGQISQVINNLVINADQAMVDGGIVKVRMQNVTVETKDHLPIDSGTYLKISVEDRGIGVSPEHIDKIFDPYFTSKLNGSGLGLAVSYSVIKNHNGHIKVESEPGKWTVFHIYLPASGKPLSEKVEKKDSITKGSGRVLIMDDDETVRNTLKDMLEILGYRVELASNGKEAVDKYKTSFELGETFDAVILDLTVPGGMGGKRAVEELLKIDPDVKAIVSSGYSNDPVTANYRQFGFSAVLSKPYNTDSLFYALSEMIACTKRN